MKRAAKVLMIVSAILAALVGGRIALLLATSSPHQEMASSTAAIGGPFALVTADGATVTDQSYRGKWLLVFFGYTFCPDACPTALSTMSVALDKLGPQATKLQPLFITVDPKRDTPRVLAEFLKSFDSRIVGLTGSEEQVDAAAKAYRVYYARHETGGDDYLVDHSAYFYLMSPEGKFVEAFAGDRSGEQIADQLTTLMSRPA